MKIIFLGIFVLIIFSNADEENCPLDELSEVSYSILCKALHRLLKNQPQAFTDYSCKCAVAFLSGNPKECPRGEYKFDKLAPSCGLFANTYGFGDSNDKVDEGKKEVSAIFIKKLFGQGLRVCVVLRNKEKEADVVNEIVKFLKEVNDLETLFKMMFKNLSDYANDFIKCLNDFHKLQ